MSTESFTALEGLRNALAGVQSLRIAAQREMDEAQSVDVSTPRANAWRGRTEAYAAAEEILRNALWSARQ